METCQRYSHIGTVATVLNAIRATELWHLGAVTFCLSATTEITCTFDLALLRTSLVDRSVERIIWLRRSPEGGRRVDLRWGCVICRVHVSFGWPPRERLCFRRGSHVRGRVAGKKRGGRRKRRRD